MGVRLSIFRLPLNIGVDITTLRKSFEYIDIDHPALQEPKFTVYKVEPADAHDLAPRSIYFGKAYRTVYLAVTGLLWKHHEYDVFFEPGSEPQENAVIGTRMVGWKVDDHAFERPIRYSLPVDLSAIVDSLADLSDEKMRAHLVKEENMSARKNIRSYFDSHLSRRFLPAFRGFYESAFEENQIVVHWLH